MSINNLCATDAPGLASESAPNGSPRSTACRETSAKSLLK